LSKILKKKQKKFVVKLKMRNFVPNFRIYVCAIYIKNVREISAFYAVITE
jgi:hypothetical protein